MGNLELDYLPFLNKLNYEIAINNRFVASKHQ